MARREVEREEEEEREDREGEQERREAEPARRRRRHGRRPGREVGKWRCTKRKEKNQTVSGEWNPVQIIFLEARVNHMISIYFPNFVFSFKFFPFVKKLWQICFNFNFYL